ncbi:uncharacterized protein [Nicotiana tomentosiformis]|uniref:uncharacterized protein n=1 Tax=Nicotiana tomentosiformis TaxID=4098 RepID=UPI00388C34AC
MEVYIGDMLVKFLNAGDHLKHLQETFDILRKHNMKLNPEKCTFGVSSGKFLVFLVSQRGIVVNPDKIKAIEDISDQLSNVKESPKAHRKIDSFKQLVVNQVYEIFDIKEERMQQYVIKVHLLARFREWSITHIPREDNAEADALANLGSSTKMKRSESGTVVQLINSVLDANGYYEWVEAGPYQKIEEIEVVDLLWANIICRFRIPKKIACDNGPQFIGAKITKFLEDLKIKRITSSLYHSSANGQAESTNKTIIQNLKKRLEAAKGNWPEELPEFYGPTEQRPSRAQEKLLFPLCTVQKL